MKNITLNNNEISKTEQLRILDRFLVDNAELEALSSKLSTFNILGVLRVEQAEIRHSNVLGWLIDPQGSHGIGQAFIRRLLSTILLENETAEIDLMPAQVELMNLVDVEVWREWKNIDIFAFSKTNNLVLLIENKIKASASRRQLNKYIAIVKKDFKDSKIIPVLLTLEPDDGVEVAEDTGYVSYSHTQVFHVMDYVVRQRKDRIPEDAKIFLDHYLTTLRRITMQDDEMVSLCKTIYRKHKNAIDLIIEWGATTQFGAAAEEFLSENKELIQLCVRPRGLFFVHKDWEKTMPACSDKWKHLSKPYPIVCWFRFRPPKLGFIIEVGSMEDSNKRLKLVEEFQKEGFKIGVKAFRPEAKFTRVHSMYRSIDNPDDQEVIKKNIDEIWKKSSDSFNTTSGIIKSFRW